jgi:hypothetical protein
MARKWSALEKKAVVSRHTKATDNSFLQHVGLIRPCLVGRTAAFPIAHPAAVDYYSHVPYDRSAPSPFAPDRETESPAMKTWKRCRPRVEELESRLVPSTLSQSTNWSGYAVTTGAGAVSQVAGSWVVPPVSSNVSGYSSAWVGIDGFNSSTVEQIGTDSDYVNGQAHYYAWYEMYPAGSVNLSLAINPGDKISAYVKNTGPGQFVLSITDVTTGSPAFSTTQTSSQAQQSSAEWIQEAPSSRRGILPLANFGTINFLGASATVNGTTGPADNSWSGSTLYQIDMVTKTGSPKATTSALSDSGSTSSFSVTWVSSGSGSGGKGGGHKSSNVPSPSSLQPTAPFSGVLVGVAARSQATPPALLASPFTTATATPPAVAAPARLPALPALTSTSSFLVSEPGNGDGQETGQATPPESPLPGDSAAPVDPGATLPTDGLPTPQDQ